MQFYWELQLLTRNSFFRNLPCFVANLLAVKADRISVVLNTSRATGTIALDTLSFHSIGHTTSCLYKVKFYCVYGKIFLIESFLSSRIPWVVSKHDPSHLLSVTLTLEYIRILSWSISLFSYISFLLDDVLCKIAIWADNTTLNSTCDKAYDLS